MAMDPQEQQDFLASLGMSPDAPAKVQTAKPSKEVSVSIQDNPRTIPVVDIVFDPALLDGFVLDGTDYKQASDKVFAIYKSPGRDKERNPLLHRRITEFIGQVKRSRGQQAPGYIKEKVKASKEQRSIAQVLAAEGITAEALAEFLKQQAEA